MKQKMNSNEQLILAAERKETENISRLIESGADVNLSDKNGVSPLQHAREKGFKEIEQMLIQAGAR